MTLRAGFTLVELMVSAALLALVIGYLLQSFTSQHQAYIVVDQVTEAQQNVRMVSDLLERDIREAGFMVPDAAALCGWDLTNGSDTLFVSNARALQTVDLLPDAVMRGELASRVVAGGIVGGGVGFTAGTGSQALTLAENYVDEAAGGADFATLAGVILVDTNDPNGRAACGIITAFDGANALTVDFGGTSLGPVTTAGGVVAIPAHVYQVTQPAGSPPQLFRNGTLLAGSVEDLQVAYFFDADGDRVVDPGEYLGDDDTYDPGAVDGADLREVRINLVVSTRDEDPREEFAQGIGQVTENRNPATIAGQDGLRRRIHTATVRVRNLGS